MDQNIKLTVQFWLLLQLLTVSPCHSKSFFNHPSLNDATTSKPSTTTVSTTTEESSVRDISIGPCTWVIGRKCPDNDVRFFLYTRHNLRDRQPVYIDETLDKSNISTSYFNKKVPTKIIIHGYNSDMFLSPLQKMREEYLIKGEYNIFYVDWSILSPGPCYISAVHNTRHTGACVAQLVERILDLGSRDIHVIGFSLGAQLTNYIAQNLEDFLIPRITGLDPAMPLFITARAKDKLDHTDAEFVDIIHTNALVQGKIERCGHADFYMNGGIMQNGCNIQDGNPFACSHQRAPAYFLESIRTRKGFWGWPCSSYLAYALGMCPPTNLLYEAGENIRRDTKGMFFLNTNDTSPFALGKWTDLPTLGAKKPALILSPPKQSGDPLLKQVDLWGKLDSNFNDIKDDFISYESIYSNDSGWENYVNSGSSSESNGSNSDDSIEELDVPNRYENNKADKKTERWREYRRNLTMGFIENSIFQIPQINGINRNRKRG